MYAFLILHCFVYLMVLLVAQTTHSVFVSYYAAAGTFKFSSNYVYIEEGSKILHITKFQTQTLVNLSLLYDLAIKDHIQLSFFHVHKFFFQQILTDSKARSMFFI